MTLCTPVERNVNSYGNSGDLQLIFNCWECFWGILTSKYFDISPVKLLKRPFLTKFLVMYYINYGQQTMKVALGVELVLFAYQLKVMLRAVGSLKDDSPCITL